MDIDVKQKMMRASEQITLELQPEFMRIMSKHSQDFPDDPALLGTFFASTLQYLTCQYLYAAIVRKDEYMALMQDYTDSMMMLANILAEKLGEDDN